MMHGPLNIKFDESRSHSDTYKHTLQSVGFLWTSERTVAEIFTWQHTILTRDRRQCHR